ncbi:MAG: hypothetical protein JXA69_08355 [Phycisphaerae bacterium]|nr:hypothetical protein [Phycisphaerae bacterium]
MMSKHYSIRQAACRLRATEDQVHDWIAKGSLRARYDQGRPAAIAPEDFDAFVAWRLDQRDFFGVPTDQDRTAAAVKRLYAAVGWPEPPVVFLQSPPALRLAYAMAALMTGSRRNPCRAEMELFGLPIPIGRPDWELFGLPIPIARPDWAKRGVLKGCLKPNSWDPPWVRDSQASSIARHGHHGEVQIHDPWVHRIIEPINQLIDHAVFGLVEEVTPLSVRDIINDQIRQAVAQAVGKTYSAETTYRSAVKEYWVSDWQSGVVFFHHQPPWERIGPPLWVRCVAPSIEEEEEREFRKYDKYRKTVTYRELHGVYSRQWHDLDLLCELGAARDTSQLDPSELTLLRDLEELALSAAYWWMHPRFVMISDPPQEIHWNAEGYLHNATGPAFAFSDGWRAFALNGTIVPEWLATTSAEQIDPRRILDFRNSQARSEFVRKVGIERICHACQAKVIDKQGDYELLLLNLRDRRRRPFLKMLNPSVPELWHVEGVHPSCNTVAEALAWRNESARVPDSLT